MQPILIAGICFFVYLALKFSRRDFTTPGTPLMEGLIDLHDHIFFFLVLIFFFVFCLFIFLLRRFLYNINYIYFFENFLVSKFSLYPFTVLGFFSKDIEVQEYTLYGAKERKIRSKRFTPLYQPVFVFKVFYTFFQNRAVKVLRFYRNYIHHELLEIIWTVLPACILVLISIPSFALLYAMDELLEASFVVKVVGYQWFWSYEYNRQECFTIITEGDESCAVVELEHAAIGYSSIMTNVDDLGQGSQRLLEVDHELILPKLMPMRLVIVSGDVLHSWAVPSFGIKVDAVPGRLSHIPLYLDYAGLFYGQCSELCGIGHGFMPIVLKIVAWPQFITWYWTLFF